MNAAIDTTPPFAILPHAGDYTSSCVNHSICRSENRNPARVTLTIVSGSKRRKTCCRISVGIRRNGPRNRAPTFVKERKKGGLGARCVSMDRRSCCGRKPRSTREGSVACSMESKKPWRGHRMMSLSLGVGIASATPTWRRRCQHAATRDGKSWSSRRLRMLSMISIGSW